MFLVFPEVMYTPADLYGNRFEPWPSNLSIGRTPPPNPSIADGYYAVAVGPLHGDDASVPGPVGSSVQPDPGLMRRLRDIRPAATIGATVRLFTAKQIRRSLP